MSEFEVEGHFYDPAELFAATAEDSPTGRGVVTDRLFHPDGSPRDTPAEDSSAALWGAWAEAEADLVDDELEAVDPGLYEPLDPYLLTPEASMVAEGSQLQAMADARQQDYEAELIGRVQRLAGEYDIKDPQRIEHVAAGLDQAMRAQFSAWQAAGYDAGQAAAAMWNDADLEGVIRAGLADQRYLQVTDRTQMAAWRRQQVANNEAREMMGLERQPSVFERSPTWQRLAKAVRGFEERQAAQRQWFRDRGWA
jgi:hypothetical protein